MQKIFDNADAALDGLLRDETCSSPRVASVCAASPNCCYPRSGTAVFSGLTFASNNAGVDDFGIGILLATKQVRKMMSSYVGENAEFMRQFLEGELEVEFNPQGTLAERMRAGGCGHPRFLHQDRRGHPDRRGQGGHKDFPTGKDGADETHIIERGIVADLAIVKAWKADDTGNLMFRKTARNFNVPAGMCGRVCVAEVEEIVPRGSLDPDHIHLPGIYVHRLIQGDHEKRIEQRTLREKA